MKMDTFSHQTISIGVVLAFVLVFGLVPFHVQAQDVEEVTITVGSAFPVGPGILETYGLRLMKDELLKEFTEGTIRFDFRGGPESFPPSELFSFVQQGAVEVGNLPGGYYEGQIPLAPVLNMAELPPWELRKAGVFDFINDQFESYGVKHLARAESGVGFNCYTKEKIEKPEDLAGMDIRSSPVYRPMLKHFGANPVGTPPSEIFTALDRGVVQGFCWPAAGMVVPMEWYKQVNYVIDPSFYEVEVHLLMDLDRWNRLSKQQQERLDQVARIMERQSYYYIGKKALEDRQFMVDQGLEVIEFTGETRRRFIEVAYESYWKMMLERANPDHVRTFNHLLERAGQETHFPE